MLKRGYRQAGEAAARRGSGWLGTGSRASLSARSTGTQRIRFPQTFRKNTDWRKEASRLPREKGEKGTSSTGCVGNRKGTRREMRKKGGGERLASGQSKKTKEERKGLNKGKECQQRKDSTNRKGGNKTLKRPTRKGEGISFQERRKNLRARRKAGESVTKICPDP